MTDIGYTAPVSFTGIESGLNTEQIMSAYLQIDEVPLTQLENQQTTVNNKVSAYQTIEQQLQALQSAADQVSAPDAFASAISAGSTNSSVATATTGTGATPGSVTFSVEHLATAESLVSSGTVASVNDVVASGNLLIASGASALGIGSISGKGLTQGAHTIAVTQASAGASVVGSSAISGSTQITSSNDQLSVSIDGAASSFTIADGTYTAQQLASAVSSASDGLLTAAVNNTGQLVLATNEQGSQATLQVAGGSANGALGLQAGGVISVDGQANTVTDIAATGTTSVTLNAGSQGSVQASLEAGGLSTGSLTAENVSVGNGSLASVVSAINGADAGVSAESLDVGQNQYALSISSNATGAANGVSVDPSAFSASGLGSLLTTTAGQDAVISLGGPGGYEVHSASNTVTGVMPGVSIALQGVSSTPVTVTVSPDGKAAANLVQSFVTAANTVLQTISTDTAYDQTTNTAGLLNGDIALDNLSQQILATVGQAIGTSGAVDIGTAGSSAGLSLDAKTGQIDFDASTFASDYASNASEVARLFTQTGTFTPSSGSPAWKGDLSLVYAADATQPGTYAVEVSQSASQATDTGTASFASPASAATSPESYTVSSGSASASYGLVAGQSLTEVASGLDTAFAQAGLDLSAQVVQNGAGSSLQITSSDYGSQASFSVSSSGADQLGLVGSSFVGSNLAGTINGVTASGDGQVLAAPSTDPTLAGLALMVSTPSITSATSLGQFTYTAGLAGGLANLMASASASPNGELPSTISAMQSTSKQLGSQITVEQQLVVQQQQQLEAAFNNLESTLATLKSQSSYLTSMFGTSSSSVGSLTGSSSSSSS